MTTGVSNVVLGERTSVSQTRVSAARAVLRGRDAERAVVCDLLRRAEQGSAGVVLVEGEPGIGKSLLLRAAADEAAERGFSLATGVADPLAHAIPFFSLRTALRDPLTELAAGRYCPDPPDPTHGWLAGARSRLELRAASVPVLVCLDDLHWESQATLGALRSLQRDLCRQPLAWLLARSSTVRCGADHLFSLLERDGAVRVTLGPLAEDATVMMLTDAFGAAPDSGLLALARDAAGSPSLLTELISGLRENHAVDVSGGRAVLASDGLPLRLHRFMKERLDQVSKQTRHLLVTAAILGPAFRLEDAAEMLGVSPAALFPAIEEAMDAALVTTSGQSFAFRNQLLRRAASDMIPTPARAALHRQYAEILLSRGISATAAASHLLQAAHPGDPASLPGLDRAAAQTIGAAPQVAADLAMRAVELTRPGDPAEMSRSVAAAEALAAAGRLDQAYGIVEATLAKPLPQTAEYRLRCVTSWVLCTRGQPQDAAAEAAMVLATTQLPRDLRARALTANLQALTALHAEPGVGIASAPTVRPGSRAAEAAALILHASRCWDGGQIREGLELARDAVRRTDISPDARDVQPLLTLAAALVDVRELSEAEAILAAAAASGLQDLPAGAAVALVRSRVHLAAGRLGTAATEAQAALRHAQAFGAHSYAATARSVLAVIELRRGDVEVAARHLRSRPVSGPQFADIYARSESMLAEAQIVEVRDGPAAALSCLGDFCSDLPGRPGPLLADPALAAWLTRTALAAGNEKLAAAAAETAGTMAAAYPEFRVSSPAAAHALGLVQRDPARLVSAAAEHADPWARASAAEDLGVLQAQRDDRDQAIDYLKAALGEYQQLGAGRDEARVRSRLRQMGIRRRHWSAPVARPTAGWHSLTDTQQAVAGLVAEGLSNHQVAARMYISTHTVAHHLRQAFRKLSITSRVELARVVIEQAAGGRTTEKLATLTMSASADGGIVTATTATQPAPGRKGPHQP